MIKDRKELVNHIIGMYLGDAEDAKRIIFKEILEGKIKGEMLPGLILDFINFTTDKFTPNSWELNPEEKKDITLSVYNNIAESILVQVENCKNLTNDEKVNFRLDAINYLKGMH
jgi:hypothetical protein